MTREELTNWVAMGLFVNLGELYEDKLTGACGHLTQVCVDVEGRTTGWLEAAPTGAGPHRWPVAIERLRLVDQDGWGEDFLDEPEINLGIVAVDGLRQEGNEGSN